MKAHVLYVSRRPATDTLAWPYGPEAIPCLRVLDGVKLAKAVQRELVLKGEFDGLALKFPLPRLAPALLPWIDGRTWLGENQASLQDVEPRQEWDHFKAPFDHNYQVPGRLTHPNGTDT